MKSLGKTKIEYLDFTWNPVTGCSFGCAWCWARATAQRFPMTHGWRNKIAPECPSMVTKDFSTPVLHPDRLDLPLRRKKPARIGVCFTGDLFGPEVPDEFKVRAFRVMSAAPWHDYLVLTKRAEEMARFCRSLDVMCADDLPTRPFPPRTAWLGVSVTNQAESDERVPLLLATPAARRWVSIEPCFSAMDLSAVMGVTPNITGERAVKFSMLDWVVVGSIDRPTAQYPAPRREWIDGIVEQCRAAGVPVWVKNNIRRSVGLRSNPKPGVPLDEWPQELPA